MPAHRKTIHVILGHQPNLDGTLHLAHKVRIDRALKDAAKTGNFFIFTGGETVIGAPTEAALGLQYAERQLSKVNIFTALCETQSKTTAQNFSYTRYIVQQDLEATYKIYCGRAQASKARVLMHKLWPKVDSQFIPCPDFAGWPYCLAQIVIGVPLALLDPHERWAARLSWFRNVRKLAIK